jgi:hypothetical protein
MPSASGIPVNAGPETLLTLEQACERYFPGKDGLCPPLDDQAKGVRAQSVGAGTG